MKGEKKKSFKFVDILVKQYKSPFNLTKFLKKKIQILLSGNFDIFNKSFPSQSCWDSL